MIQVSKIWSILKDHVPRKRWVSIGEIFSIVESHSTLDNEDLKVHTPTANSPRWKVAVRRLLATQKKGGKVRGRGKQ